MRWNKINITSVLEVLREMEKKDISLDSEESIIYSDGKEELKISYKRLKQEM